MDFTSKASFSLILFQQYFDILTFKADFEGQFTYYKVGCFSYAVWVTGWVCTQCAHTSIKMRNISAAPEASVPLSSKPSRLLSVVSLRLHCWCKLLWPAPGLMPLACSQHSPLRCTRAVPLSLGFFLMQTRMTLCTQPVHKLPLCGCLSWSRFGLSWITLLWMSVFTCCAHAMSTLG